MDEKPTIYFRNAGNANTNCCLKIVRSEVEENGYRFVIVASATGKTGGVFADSLKGLDANLIIVSHADDKKPGKIHQMTRNKIINRGATLFIAPSLTFSLDQAFGSKYQESEPSFIMRETLSVFGQGIRLCCESVMAATDGGLITDGLEVLAVAGTDSGADTVAIIKAASSRRFRELRVLEILAKPRA